MCAVCVEAAILWCGALAPAPLVLAFAAYMQAAGVQTHGLGFLVAGAVCTQGVALRPMLS